MKKILLLFLLSLIPSLVSAKTVTCTSEGNFIEGKNVYDSITVICTEGKVNPFAICEVGSSFEYEDIGSSTCNVVNPYNAIAGKNYSYTFELILENFGEEDTLIVDGDDTWSIFARNGACYSKYDGEESGCSVTTKNHLAKASDGTEVDPDPTSTDPDPISVTVYWVTFDVNGGKETIEKQAVEENNLATEPTITRAGYIFDGWYLGNSKYDFTRPVTENITLKAKWKEDTTGKKAISFINLSNLIAPYSGKELDTSVTIETTKTWTKELFSVGIEWFRGKDRNNVTEKVESPANHKAENGYYYQAVLTITPGNGYTLNGTKIKLNGKSVTATKEENRLIINGNVYGPVEEGVNLDPAVTIKSINETIALDEAFETHPIELIYDATRQDEVIVDGDSFIKITDTENFAITGPGVKGSGDRNLVKSSWKYGDDGVAILTEITLKAKTAGTYTTDIYFVDKEGREYCGTVTVTRTFKKAEKVELKSSSNAEALIEFLGEVDKHWQFSFSDSKTNEYKKILADSVSISSLGGLVAIYNINITSEDGEKTNGSFKIMIKLTDEMKKYNDFSFVYVSDDITDQAKAGEVIRAKKDGDYIVATLPHLSTYALVGNNVENTTTPDTATNVNTEIKTNNPPTGDNVILYLSLLGLSLIGLICTGLYIKKSSN